MVKCGLHYNPRFQAWSLLGWITCYLALITIIQSNIPYPIDNDTAYHFSVAQLMRKYGVLHSFPWTPFSLQADHYADKEFLFHILLIPFTGLGLINASRIVGVLAGTLVLSTLYAVLRQQGVRYSGIWTLVPLGTGIFVYRLSMVRPHLFSIVLALLMLWAYLKGRQFILFLAAIVYPLSYVAFWQLPLILIFAAESARFLSHEQFRLKLFVTVVAGIVIGVVLHPNSLNLISINWIHMYDILFQGAWGSKAKVIRLGEFLPVSGIEWVLSLSVNALFTISALVISLRDRRNSSGTLAFAIASLIFGLLTALSMRFAEYFVPFSVAAIALACRKYESRMIAPLVLAGTLTAGSVHVLPLYISSMVSLENRDSYIDQSESALLSRTVPVGSQVFTCNMDYTGNLMVALPERYFMVAADPMLFYKKYPGLYDTWMITPYCVNAAELIRTQFNSRFVICKNDQQYGDLFDHLSSEPGVTMQKTPRWVVFDLGRGIH